MTQQMVQQKTRSNEPCTSHMKLAVLVVKPCNSTTPTTKSYAHLACHSLLPLRSPLSLSLSVDAQVHISLYKQKWFIRTTNATRSSSTTYMFSLTASCDLAAQAWHVMCSNASKFKQKWLHLEDWSGKTKSHSMLESCKCHFLITSAFSSFFLKLVST